MPVYTTAGFRTKNLKKNYYRLTFNLPQSIPIKVAYGTSILHRSLDMQLHVFGSTVATNRITVLASKAFALAKMAKSTSIGTKVVLILR